jgi:hypothetical protein
MFVLPTTNAQLFIIEYDTQADLSDQLAKSFDTYLLNCRGKVEKSAACIVHSQVPVATGTVLTKFVEEMQHKIEGMFDTFVYKQVGKEVPHDGMHQVLLTQKPAHGLILR